MKWPHSLFSENNQEFMSQKNIIFSLAVMERYRVQ